MARHAHLAHRCWGGVGGEQRLRDYPENVCWEDKRLKQTFEHSYYHNDVDEKEVGKCFIITIVCVEDYSVFNHYKDYHRALRMGGAHS